MPSSNIDTDKTVEPEDKKPSDTKEETKSEEKAAEEKAKEEDKKSEETKPEEKKSEEVNPDEKKDDSTEAKSDDAKKNAEAEVKAEEEKKSDETKDADAKTDEEKTEEGTEGKVEEKTEEGENAEANTDAKELEVGTALDPDKLTPLGAGPEGDNTPIEVDSFDKLKEEIESTKAGEKKTIVITANIDITEKITVPAGADIILTSNNQEKADDPWKKIEQPKDFANQGEKKQREIIDEARDRGEQAIKDAEKNIIKENDEYYYNFDGKDIIIKRSNTFTGTMFEVIGKLKLGDKDNSISFNGDNISGTFFDVQKGGELTLKNGTIANGKNYITGGAPVKIRDKAKFIMDGGRITANEIIPDETQYSLNAGAVYVSTGGKFIMNNGMIDHNIGAAGAVFAGDLFGAQGKDLLKNPGDAAIVETNGGYIISNSANTLLKLTGGIGLYCGATLNLNDGVLADNFNPHTGGAIFISDSYIYNAPNILAPDYKGEKYADTSGKLEIHLKENKTELNLNGGLIYRNKASYNAGGIYVDSNDAHFNAAMLLNNESGLLGGGIYISYPPRLQSLKKILISENKAEYHGDYHLDEKIGVTGKGGGIWNCPTGYIHIGDGHSVYSFNNEADTAGDDLLFSKKTSAFILNKENIKDKFYSHVSPVTEFKNIIKYLEDYNRDVSIPERMSYTDDVVALKAVYSEDLVKEAWKNSGVFIMGNKSSYGAGLGSNANLETPKDDGNIEFEFNKKWHPDLEDTVDLDNTDIHLDIFIVPTDVDEAYVRSQYGKDNKLFKYGEVTLNKANNWHTRFSDWKNNKYLDLPNVTKDNGLPFTNEELAKRGYKYLIVERETAYSTYIDKKEKTEKNGKIEITGLDSATKKPNYFLYYIDKSGEAHYLTKADENNVFTHPLLNAKIVKEIYYGAERPFIEEGKAADGKNGYAKTDKGYAFFIKEEKDGLVLYLPHLYNEGDGSVKFKYHTGDNSQEKTVKVYEFDITNSPYGDAKITKAWETGNGERQIPDEVSFYVLENNKKIIESYYEDANGKIVPVYKSVTVRKTDGWTATIDKLNPILLKNGAYSVEEIAVPGFTASYKIVSTEEKDSETSIQFRLKMLDDFEKDNKKEDGTKFVASLGDIDINLYIDGEHRYTKKIESKAANESVEYTLDDGKVLFGFNGEKVSVYAKGMNIKVRYYNAMENDILGKSFNIYLQRDEFGRYNLMVPNVLKDGEYYKAFKVTEKDKNTAGDYPEIEKFIVDKDSYKKVEYTFEVTNTPEPNEPEPRKTFVRVNKVWEALGETRDIQVELYINGEASGKILTLNAANGWSASFTGLDIDDGMGNLYVYTVKEVGENDNIYNIDDRKFEVSYSGDMYKGFTIVNKEVPPEEPEEPEEEKPEEPEEPEEEREKPQDKNRLPKTGVTEDALSIFLGLMILLGLVYIKKKYILEKSK